MPASNTPRVLKHASASAVAHAAIEHPRDGHARSARADLFTVSVPCNRRERVECAEADAGGEE